jgi:hypothetical protein
MNEYQRDERRRAVRNNIDAALGHIERDGATGIEMQLRDGAHASGDWARTSDAGVTVFSSVMGITSAQTLLLDDVLVVQTVWSDVTPAFVAPDRFDVVFDRLLVEAVTDRFGDATIADALTGEGTLGDRFARIGELDPWESDEVRGMVAARLPRALSPAGDLRLLKMPVITFVESERDTMRGLLDPTLVAYVAAEPLTSDAPASPKRMLDLSRDHPEIANAMLIAAMKLEIRRGSEPYVPLDKLRFEIGGMLALWFRRRGS